MAHTFTTNFRTCDFNATLLTDDSLKTYTLVFAAIAFPVASWSEDFFAEQTVALWAQCAVVDRLWLFNFAA